MCIFWNYLLEKKILGGKNYDIIVPSKKYLVAP